MQTGPPKRSEMKNLTQILTGRPCQSWPRVRSALFCVSLICALTGAALAQRNINHQDALQAAAKTSWSPRLLREPFVPDPIFVYNNWSTYDELSDNVTLTEQLAIKELDGIIRLRHFGARFDYYMMDAFWFAQDGGYKTWRKSTWPNGPDQWLKLCKHNGLTPGLWFGTNTLVKIDPAPEWQNSLNRQRQGMSFYEGGFLASLVDVLQYWYERGIRMFKFDFVDFTAATPKAEQTQSKEQICSLNVDAFRAALKNFRRKNPDVVLVGFNGFGGDLESTAGPFPFRHPIDLRWLEVFDSLYSGDPRPSDVPEMNFWRSMDIYSDHMVRRYEQSGVPLERIDSTGFMIGSTGTIYYRRMNAWRGALILMLARGGWVNTVLGNLELFSDDDARWFAKVQSLYLKLQAMGRTKTFGGIPGELQPYGFGSVDNGGAVYTVMNPEQSIAQVEMPQLSRLQFSNETGKVLFRDAGFVPELAGNRIKLGPGQLAVVGFGIYANPEFDLGLQEDVRIPLRIQPFAADFVADGKNVIKTDFSAPERGDLRIIIQQRGKDGQIKRSSGGAPPNGITMGKVLILQAWQNGRLLPIDINYDKAIWSGLSWAAGEIKHSAIAVGKRVTIMATSRETDSVTLEARVFTVEY
jgi:hypothetical protein